MSWGDELVQIRRFLRDPNGTIWSEAFLRHLWNDVQNDFQHKTQVLEGIHTQRIPGLYHVSYLFDWEYAYLDVDQLYQALSLHDDYAVTNRWEPQQITGLDAEVTDYGIHFCHPWEAFMGFVPGEIVKFRFPSNLHSVLYLSYSDIPLNETTRKRVQATNASYIAAEGTPVAYYRPDETDNSFVLYPRPGTAFTNDIEGDGVAFFAEDDTEDTTTGTIATRTGSSDLESGAAIDIVETADNVFIVYQVTPHEMQTVSDEPDYPAFLRKYIRYGVIGRAYGGNTDGRIRSLADHWDMRYQLGVQYVKRFLRNRRADRDYRLTGGAEVRRRTIRHPRLPSTYPATTL